MPKNQKFAVAVAPAPVVQPRLYSIKQAAAYLNSTIWTIRTLVWKKELPHVQIGRGRGYKFDRADLDKFVDSLKVAGGAA